MLSNKSLEWVKEQLSYTDDHYTTYEKNMLNNIKQDLERLETLEKENKKLKEKYNRIKEDAHILSKACNQYEKVIEILKDRIRPILIPSNDVYILRTNAWSYIIQEQDYKLLKEVLENEK